MTDAMEKVIPRTPAEGVVDAVEFLVPRQWMCQGCAIMKFLLVWLFLTPCLLAGFKYPPQADDARVEVYRKVGDVELRMWIFGETDPAKRSW